MSSARTIADPFTGDFMCLICTGMYQSEQRAAQCASAHPPVIPGPVLTLGETMPARPSAPKATDIVNALIRNDSGSDSEALQMVNRVVDKADVPAGARAANPLGAALIIIGLALAVGAILILATMVTNRAPAAPGPVWVTPTTYGPPGRNGGPVFTTMPVAP